MRLCRFYEIDVKLFVGRRTRGTNTLDIVTCVDGIKAFDLMDTFVNSSVSRFDACDRADRITLGLILLIPLENDFFRFGQRLGPRRKNCIARP